MKRTVLSKERLFLAAMIAGGLIFTTAALFLAQQVTDIIELLFGSVLTGWTMIPLMLWVIAAAGMKHLLIGRTQRTSVITVAMIAWPGLYLSMLIAVVLLAFAWLGSLMFDGAAPGIFSKALVLMIVVSALTRLVVGAISNTALVLRGLRAKST